MEPSTRGVQRRLPALAPGGQDWRFDCGAWGTGRVSRQKVHLGTSMQQVIRSRPGTGPARRMELQAIAVSPWVRIGKTSNVEAMKLKNLFRQRRG
jgi:hypothetical protein